MATKLGRLLTYPKQLSPIKLLDTLAAYFWKITWQSKTIKSPLPLCLWPPNLPGWRRTLTGSYHIVTLPIIRGRTWMTWQFENFTFQISQDLWPLKLVECWLQRKALARKHLSLHRFLAFKWIGIWVKWLLKSCQTSSSMLCVRSLILFSQRKVILNISTIFMINSKGRVKLECPLIKAIYL